MEVPRAARRGKKGGNLGKSLRVIGKGCLSSVKALEKDRNASLSFDSQRVLAALERSGAEGRLLEVEITECILMTRPQTTAILQELSGLGVRTSTDDFGTGYSSLAYLTHLPVYKLKIDRSFVTSLSSDPNVRAITTAIITMSSALGLRTIAEGVETHEQLDILKKLGCHEIQGYYFSPPLPAEDFSRWMASPFPAKI